MSGEFESRAVVVSLLDCIDLGAMKLIDDIQAVEDDETPCSDRITLGSEHSFRSKSCHGTSINVNSGVNLAN